MSEGRWMEMLGQERLAHLRSFKIPAAERRALVDRELSLLADERSSRGRRLRWAAVRMAPIGRWLGALRPAAQRPGS